jgi:hypothetical protein
VSFGENSDEDLFDGIVLTDDRLAQFVQNVGDSCWCVIEHYCQYHLP